MRQLIILFFFIFVFFSGQAQNVDINILRPINNNHSAFGDQSMKVITNSLVPITLLTPATIIAAGWIKKDTSLYLKGLNIGLAEGTNLVVTYIIKYNIKRQRPYQKYSFIIAGTNDIDNYSFPSAHTSGLFATATSLSLNFPKWYVIIPAYTWASTVGYSRLYFGVHYPSDILAGAIIGTGCAYLSWKGQQWINRKYPVAKKKVVFF